VLLLLLLLLNLRVTNTASHTLLVTDKIYGSCSHCKGLQQLLRRAAYNSQFQG
jgi:hypothetical protein